MTAFAEGLNDEATGWSPSRVVSMVSSTIEPLVEVVVLPSGDDTRATCRDCGVLPPLGGQGPQSLRQASLVRQRHLADHLAALAAEIAQAAR